LAVAIVSSLISMLALNLFQGMQTKVEETEIPKPINLVFPEIKNTKIFESHIKARENRIEIDLDANDENMQAFLGYKYAQDIKLKGCNVTDKGIAFLKDSKILRLSLVECNVNSVDNIAKLSYLQNLDLRANPIDDQCLKVLADLKMLKYLNIQETKVTEKGIFNLAKSNSLVGIYLPEKKFSGTEIRRLKERMPFCQFYTYSKSSRMGELERASKITDQFEKYSHLYSIAKQINPDHSGLSDYLSLMAEKLRAQGKKAEASKFFRLANEILLKNGNLANLPAGLIREMSCCLVEKIAPLADRAAELAYDTLPHDSPTLVQTLQEISNYPRRKEDADKVVNYCQTGIDLIEQFPNRQDRKALSALYEKAGWTYYVALQNPKALPYFQKNVTLLRHEIPRNDLLFARAMLELGHALPEFTARKSAYDEGMELLEKLKFPEDYNLKEHYCDACSALHDAYVAQGNHEEAARYLRKGIECVRQMKHSDDYNRAAIFKRWLHDRLEIIRKTKAR
ncbi:MAG: hypothetical protein IAF58_03515, partial [Leptolyngbya sp.]|nr:hypothetical protein [Candidatus Melainabacteria bacterium]